MWTQERDDFDSLGEFDFGRQSRHVFDAQADNVFLVKLSYHLGL